MRSFVLTTASILGVVLGVAALIVGDTPMACYLMLGAIYTELVRR
jgi:hypothetical protein